MIHQRVYYHLNAHVLGQRVGQVGEGGEGRPEEADQIEDVIGRVTG